MTEIKKNKLSELADLLIEKIKNREDFFSDFTVVVPGIKTEQWFKTYWLRTQSDVLMNVSFKRVDGALLDLLDTPEGFKLISREELKMLIIKHLASKTASIPADVSAYYETGAGLNEIKLYDFAEKLSQLYIEYDIECFNATGWEKDLYDAVMDDAYGRRKGTLRSIFSKHISFRPVEGCLYFFGICELSKIQQDILDAYSGVGQIEMYRLCPSSSELTQANPAQVIAAPSMLREVEAVHTEICKLLSAKTSDSEGKTVPVNKYSDFLVLAPDISVYENVIARVFNQDGIDFPNIPYSINDRYRTSTDVVEGLKKLVEIAEKKFYTRLDFAQLINNRSVMLARGIDAEDIDALTNSVLEMNVFRNHQSSDDWNYARNRMLISKISDVNDVDENIVEITSGGSASGYVPYQGRNMEDGTIIKFVKLVDDLNIWMDLVANTPFTDNSLIDGLLAEMDKWFSCKNDYGEEKNSRYRRIINAAETWKSLDIPSGVVPLKTFFFELYSAGEINKFNAGDFFTKGITFANFDENSIVEAKYIYFLNAASNRFPKQLVQSELDLRANSPDDKLKRTTKSFIIQSENAGSFSVSFVNSNLKTDEEYFLSPLVAAASVVEIPIDETRSWDNLFTEKEYQDKQYRDGLLSSGGASGTSKKTVVSGNLDMAKKLKVRELADFLKEPLSATAKRLFGLVDETDEELRDQFEPFEIDNLSASGLLKDMLIADLKGLAKTDAQLLEYMDRMGNIPDITDDIKQRAFRNLKEESARVKELVEEKLGANCGRDYDIVSLGDLKLANGSDSWTLVSNSEICRKEAGTDLTYVELKKLKDKPKDSEYMLPYIVSLMDVASRDDANTYNVKIEKKSSKTYSATPAEARETLNKIHDAMYDYKHIKYCDFDSKAPADLDALVSELGSDNGHGTWNYFSDKKLFDLYDQLGYTKAGFEDEYKEMSDTIASLINIKF